LATFCKLADPTGYVACPMNLTAADDERRHWAGFFKRHFELVLQLAAESDAGTPADLAPRLDRSRRCLHRTMDELSVAPDKFGSRITIITMARLRDRCLREGGFADAFALVKRRENERTLPLLPVVCRQLDLLTGESQFRAIVEGVFAGNIFDMGAEATAGTFRDTGPDFFQTRQELRPRPWLIDDYDCLSARFLQANYRKAVFFIDNAGSDFLLGALPMIRWIASRGTRVVLAANEYPTLNDMTIHDVRVWWPQVLQVEPSMADLPIELVSTGTGDPLIDLSDVSDDLNRAADDADLVILEGMGRGVESNLDAGFTCDALNIAMIKDEIVAQRVGGKLFDVVCRFR
jgi:type II pantothenate kinase